MSWRTIKLKQVLKQYRIENIVQNDKEYKQVTISKHDGVKYRGIKNGKEIGRKRQFLIDLKEYPNTLMLVRQGVYEGAIGIAPLEVDGCIVTENMPMFSVEGIEVDYIKLVLKSSFFKDELGKIPTAGSAQKSIHERQILEIEIPYPDKQEQLNIINSYRNNKNKIENISSIINHQLDLVKQLRQAFLREAMQGKLTVKWREENPDVEPASELLKKIKAEKEKLVKEGKLKKQKPLPPIKEDEIPFEIPESWVWCNFDDISEIIFDMEHKMPKAVTNVGVMFLSAKDLLDDGKINYTNGVKYISEEDYDYFTRNFKPQKNDIIYSRRGANLGKARIVNTDEKYLASYSCCTIRTLNPNLRFIYYLLDSGFTLKQATLNTTANSIPDLGVKKIQRFKVPLPSVTEQQKIVKQLDELMQYCDKMEESIKTSQQQNEM